MSPTLILRRAQMEVFEQDAVRRFGERLARHAGQKFPKHIEAFEPKRLRAFLNEGLGRARRYGIEGERGGRLFVECLFLFGHQFDFDPQLPWASGTLSDRNLTEEAKVDQLHEQSRDYLDRTAGASGQNFERALSRLRDEADEMLPPRVGWESEESRMGGLQWLFPEKAEYLGYELVRYVVRCGLQQAERYGITGQRGVAVFLSLMFLLGSGFDSDPLFPWIAAILSNGKEQSERAEQLYREAIGKVEQWIGPGQTEEA